MKFGLYLWMIVLFILCVGDDGWSFIGWMSLGVLAVCIIVYFVIKRKIKK